MELERRDEFDRDLPPEYCHYQDEGCDLAASCLDCPFEQCIFDEPGGKQHMVKILRDNEIVRLHFIEGMDANDLSEMFGVSKRTVQRAINGSEKKRVRKGKSE